MSFELFVALRYMRARNVQVFTSVVAFIAVAVVALGVCSLIITTGIMNGFSEDLRDKIAGVNAHVIVLQFGGSMQGYEEAREAVLTVPEVKAATPFIYSELMISSKSGAKGLVLRGIDLDTASGVLTILDKLVAGSLEGLDAGSVPGIVIGEKLAISLNLNLGDRVNLLSPTGERTSAGFTPSIKSFQVAAIFSSGMFEYDSSLGFASLDATRNLLGMDATQVSGLDVVVDAMDRADLVAQMINQKLGDMFHTRHWKEMNSNLFAALQLEKTAMTLLLTLVVLVGSFSIVTTLVMLVMEKTKDIAILMSMGATRKMVRRIFIVQGVVIGCVGTVIGYALGFLAAFLLRKYKFIELPKGVYSLDHLPVVLHQSDLLLIGIGAMLLCFLATLYPAHKAASLDVVEALRSS